jgi:hypothetical protein
MTGLNYCILIDVRDKVDVSAVLGYMKGYLSSKGRVISYSIMDETVYLHHGTHEDLQLVKEYLTSMSVTECINNNWKAFSDSEKAFLYIENRELFKVWSSE